MAGVSTQFSIQDRMTSRLNTMTSAAERLNRSLDTTDALSDALFREICGDARVPVQRYSNRADLPGGATLGNISAAHLSVHSIDIGLPQLAMHAAYEVAGARDYQYLVRAMTAYYSRRIRFGPMGVEL